jgi:hypothetical protein
MQQLPGAAHAGVNVAPLAAQALYQALLKLITRANTSASRCDLILQAMHYTPSMQQPQSCSSSIRSVDVI